MNRKITAFTFAFFWTATLMGLACESDTGNPVVESELSENPPVYEQNNLDFEENQNNNNSDNENNNTGNTGPQDTDPVDEPPQTTEPEGFTCQELYECEDNCAGNQSCGQLCYDSGTDLAREQWTTLIQCGQVYCDGQVANAQEYKLCLNQMCPGDYATCFGGSSTGGNNHSANGGNGPATCGAGYACVQGCYETATSESSFMGCVDGCYTNMDSQANYLMGNLVNCADVECSNVPGSVNNYFQCISDFCGSELSACEAHGGSGQSSTDGSGSGTSTTPAPSDCLGIHESVLAVCVPAFSTCAQACTTESCQQGCDNEITSCIEELKNSAPAQAATDFQAVLTCRQEHYESCYDEGNAAYSGCSSSCAASDNACLQSCEQQAGIAYEDCFDQNCATQYATCGIQ